MSCVTACLIVARSRLFTDRSRVAVPPATAAPFKTQRFFDLSASGRVELAFKLVQLRNLSRSPSRNTALNKRRAPDSHHQQEQHFTAFGGLGVYRDDDATWWLPRPRLVRVVNVVLLDTGPGPDVRVASDNGSAAFHATAPHLGF